MNGFNLTDEERRLLQREGSQRFSDFYMENSILAALKGKDSQEPEEEYPAIDQRGLQAQTGRSNRSQRPEEGKG